MERMVKDGVKGQAEVDRWVEGPFVDGTGSEIWSLGRHSIAKNSPTLRTETEHLLEDWTWINFYVRMYRERNTISVPVRTTPYDFHIFGARNGGTKKAYNEIRIQEETIVFDEGRWYIL